MRSCRNVVEDLYGKEFFVYLNEDAPESADVFKRPGKRGDAREIPLSVEDLTALLDAVLAALP